MNGLLGVMLIFIDDFMVHLVRVDDMLKSLKPISKLTQSINCTIETTLANNHGHHIIHADRMVNHPQSSSVECRNWKLLTKHAYHTLIDNP